MKVSALKPYFLHMRPRSFAPSFLMALTGYAASPAKPVEGLELAGDLASLFLIYSVLLFGGTCALNTAFDGPTNELNYLENPPEIPRFLGGFGLAAMALGVAFAAFHGLAPAALAGIALVLSYLYSARIPGLRWRGKEVGIVDNLISGSGCGVIGVLLGYSMTDAPIGSRAHLLSLAFTVTVVGSYPITQIFQLKPTDTYETARNYSTLLGPRLALRLCSVLLLAGMLIAVSSLGKDIYATGAAWSLAGYLIFCTMLMGSGAYSWKWSKSPFDQPKARQFQMVKLLLGARVFWIAAEWVNT